MLTITVLRETSIQPSVGGRALAGDTIRAREEVPFEEGSPMARGHRRFIGVNGKRFWMSADAIRVTEWAWLADLVEGDAVKVCADGHGGARDKSFVTRRTARRIFIGNEEYDGKTGRERDGERYLLPWTGADESRHARPTYTPPHCLEMLSEDTE